MHERLHYESAGEQQLSELKALAASQPIISDLPPNSPTTHTQYRDNFFRRFEEIQAVRQERATDSQVFYVRMVKERFGFDLVAFYDQQSQLCDEICSAVAAKEPYDRLVAGYYHILAQEQTGELPPGSAQELNTAVLHPLGIEAVGMHYWDKINPLLAKAYNLMDAQTLNAPFLAK
jgi:hypothetical protein